MIPRWTRLGIISALAVTPVLAMDINWYTVDGGGGMFSTNGAFKLSGTIGQPDAGTVMTGGNFELAGGFWAITGEARSKGDADGDGDIDLEDHRQLTDCMAGPGASPSPTAPGFSPQDCLDAFDFEDDSDVDLIDWRGFIEFFSP